MTIEFIYFDLGNVLLDFSHERACRQMAAVAGKLPDEVRQVVFDSGLNARYERGEITTKEFHHEFDQRCGTTTPFDELIQAWNDIFELHARSVPIVGNLRAAGHRLGVLTNTCHAHWQYVGKKYPLLQTLFDPLVTSFDVGVMKPDKEIYEHATQRVQVAPDRIFYVDDRLENVEGAIGCGWQAVQFSSALQLAEELCRRGVEFNR